MFSFLVQIHLSLIFVILSTKPKIFSFLTFYSENLLTSSLDPTNLTRRHVLLVPGPSLARGAEEVKNTSPHSQLSIQ